MTATNGERIVRALEWMLELEQRRAVGGEAAAFAFFQVSRVEGELFDDLLALWEGVGKLLGLERKGLVSIERRYDVVRVDDN